MNSNVIQKKRETDRYGYALNSCNVCGRVFGKYWNDHKKNQHKGMTVRALEPGEEPDDPDCELVTGRFKGGDDDRRSAKTVGAPVDFHSGTVFVPSLTIANVKQFEQTAKAAPTLFEEGLSTGIQVEEEPCKSEAAASSRIVKIVAQDELDQDCIDLLNAIEEDNSDPDDAKWSMETLRLAHLLTQQAVGGLLSKGSRPHFEQILTKLKVADGQNDH